MAKNAAEVVIETLILAGVKRIYGLPGDSLNGITEAIRTRSEIQWIHVRHEEVAAFAAGAEAHLTGDLVVCAGSCGPGNLHLINGLYDCHRSRVPVLAIAAQIPSSELGTGYFQETHPEALFKDCSHFCELATEAKNVPRLLGIAMRTAIAKRGVSVLIAPGDVLTADCSAAIEKIDLSSHTQTVSHASLDEIGKAAALLNGAKKVTILGGAGCANAHAELMAVAARLQSPIVHALRGKEFLEHDNPFDVGLTGLIGVESGFHAMKSCDVLLMVGTDFPYPQFYPEKAKIIQIDSRGEQIGRRTHVDIGLIGQSKATLALLLTLLDQKSDSSHLDAAIKDYRKVRDNLDELATSDSGRSPIHPQAVAKLLSETAAADAIFSCDVGTPTVWAARYLQMNGQRRLLGSFNHGTMANALPQAIGAQAAFPKRQVISLSGDGGLAMLLGDLLTLKQMHLPVKIVVFNNSALSFVELEMKAAGLLNFGTDLQNPSFADVASACGLFAKRVEKPQDLQAALAQSLAHDGPALVDVVVNRQELSLPPSIQASQAAGFGLYILRAILNGRGDEVVDLATSNLVR